MRRADTISPAEAAASKPEADQRKSPGGGVRLVTIMQSFETRGNTNLHPARIAEEQRKKISGCGLKLSSNHTATLQALCDRATFVSGVVDRRSFLAAIIALVSPVGQPS
jgi:hypothetical protein